VRQPPSCQITKMVSGAKIIRRLALVGVWVFLICFGLIAVDRGDSGPLTFYIGVACRQPHLRASCFGSGSIDLTLRRSAIEGGYFVGAGDVMTA